MMRFSICRRVENPVRQFFDMTLKKGLWNSEESINYRIEGFINGQAN